MMVDRFVSSRTGPALLAGEPGAVIRRAKGGVEMVNLVWGLSPGRDGGRAMTVVRCEGRRFVRRRCLVPASEFFFSAGSGTARRKWRFTLADGDWFYFAAIWQPASRDWPPAYAILTIPSGPDLAPFRDRQMAVIRREARMKWLDGARPETETLKALPAGSWRAEQVEGPPEEAKLFDW